METKDLKYREVDQRADVHENSGKRGLILEGGAMRGMYTCGVIDVMMEQGITYDGAIGVSAGAVFGCNYKSRQIGRPIRYNKRFCRDKRYCSLHSWITTGDLYGAEFCYETLPYELDLFDIPTYAANPMDFYVVCTDVDTGEAVYKNCPQGERRDIAWMRASASMPVASRPVELDGFRLLDGGISDSVPLQYFESIGYERNVVVLTQPAGYRKSGLRYRTLMKFLLRKYPKVYDRLALRHEDYNRTMEYIERREREGSILVLRPDEPLRIGSVEKDPNELERVYRTGRSVAEREMEHIQNFLK